MRKLLFLAIVISFFSVVSFAQTSNQSAPASSSTYVRPSAEKRFKRFVDSTVGPFAWVGIAAGAGFSTATNNPEEWERTGEGFARRLGSNFGKNVIRNTTIYGLDEALKLDSHYYRSTKRDVGSRLGNAVSSTFTARTKSGKRTVGVPRIVGTYTASVIAAEAWYPPGYNWKDGMKSGTISLGVNSMINIFREFVFKR